MKYIVTGSTGHISKPLASKLVAAGHEVIVITSRAENAREIEALGAKAAVGSVEDVKFLETTLNGADAVYTMVPPNFSPSNWKEYIGSIGKKYATAIRAAAVKNVVNLSSVGAHLPDGCGPVNGIQKVEEALNDLDGVNVLHLRPGFFYYNFFANVGMIQHMGIIGANYGIGTKIYMTHTDDIAEVAANALLALDFQGKSYRYVVSDVKTTNEIAVILGSAIGKPELPWIDFPDNKNTGGLVQAGLSEEVARNYTEMGAAMRSGKMFEHFCQENPGFIGRTKFEVFATDFAKAFEAQPA